MIFGESNGPDGEGTMEEKNSDYKKYTKQHAPKSPMIKNCVMAFISGGAVCAAGQGIFNLYRTWGANEDNAALFCSVTFVVLAVLMTGIGVFDTAARYAGAGVLVPITGFANAVAAPAIDSRTEGYVLGVGAKIFTVAGPVILYGVTSGAVYGVVYMIGKALCGG